MEIERVYAWLPHGEDAVSKAALADPPKPRLIPSDWMLEIGERFDMPYGNDPSRTVPARRIVATRPMAVIAANEDEARSIAVGCCATWRRDLPAENDHQGWRSRDDAVVAGSVRREASTPRHRRSFEVDVRRLASPDRGLHLLTTDQMFETFRWMLASSKGYDDGGSLGHPGTASVRRLLRTEDGSWSTETYAVGSRGNLHARLTAGLLGSAHDLYDMWREENGIAYGSRKTIEAVHYGAAVDSYSAGHAGEGLEKALWGAMSRIAGHEMVMSPNTVHPDATTITAFDVRVDESGFSFELSYGMGGTGLQSSWRHVLARTRGGEAFYETAERAMTLLLELVPSYRSEHRMRESA